MALTGVERLNYEKDLVAPYVGAIGWRSMFNFAWPLAGWIATLSLYVTGSLPLWAGALLATLLIQALYMPVHEAVHKTHSGGQSSLVWIDRIIGSVAGWPLLLSFREHTISHLMHHTHANDERDPDGLNAKGTPLGIAARVLLGMVFYPLGPAIAVYSKLGRLLPARFASDLRRTVALRGPEATRAARLVATSHVAVLAAGTILGYADVVWLLWYVPAWAGRIWLTLVFGWLPHHPHSETGRYRDTRIFTFPASTFLIRGHDYHLLHHMFPRVPHYKLKHLWFDIGPHLAEQGARIEGRAARELSTDDAASALAGAPR